MGGGLVTSDRNAFTTREENAERRSAGYFAERECRDIGDGEDDDKSEESG